MICEMDGVELTEAVKRIRWRHQIDLGHGIVTPGNDRSSERLAHLMLPESLQGKTVLDIGAWDGFYSFEAERRGARRVVAADIWDPKYGVTQDGFNLARRVLNSRVEDIRIDPLDLAPERIGKFDIVLFLGVLYHLRHPLLALERIHGVTDELLIAESHVDLLSRRKPMMVCYPGSQLNDDPSNWWGPNPAALCAMIRSAGFREVRERARWPSLGLRLLYAIKSGLRKPGTFWPRLNWSRMVVHAQP